MFSNVCSVRCSVRISLLGPRAYLYASIGTSAALSHLITNFCSEFRDSRAREGEQHAARRLHHHHGHKKHKRPEAKLLVTQQQPSMLLCSWAVVVAFAPAWMAAPHTLASRTSLRPCPHLAISAPRDYSDEGLDAEVKAVVENKAREVSSLRQKIRSAEAWADVLQGTVKALSMKLEAAECRADEAEMHMAELSTEIEGLHAEVDRHRQTAIATAMRLGEYTGKAPLAHVAYGLSLAARSFWDGRLLPAVRWLERLPRTTLQSVLRLIVGLRTSMAAAIAWVPLGPKKRRRDGLEPQPTALMRRRATKLYWRLQGHNAASHDITWQRVSVGVSASGSRLLRVEDANAAQDDEGE